MWDLTDNTNALSKCGNSTTFITNDVYEHAGNLTDWEQCYDQISAGAFQGSVTEIAFDGLQVFHEFTSRQLHQNCNVWADSIWLGIAANEGSESRINGIVIEDNELMCRPGSCEFELITPQNHDIYGIVVGQQQLVNMGLLQGIEIDLESLSCSERISLPDAFMANLRFLLHRLLREQTVLPGAKFQQDIVMMALLEVLQKQSPLLAKPSSYKHRKQVVDRVVLYLESHKDRPVRIAELCAAVGASRRTLQYSFESIVGISPVQYVRAIRLNGARRCLQSADEKTTVADVAAAWGFFHLSQFAKDYRELFGERPSDTRVI